MIKTTNFGLNKPELSDPVDVRVFNENTDKIDEELGKYYDLFKDGNFIPSFDLSAKLEEIDVTEYLNFAEMYSQVITKGKIPRLWFTRSESGATCEVLLTDIYDEAGTNVYFCGLSSHPYYDASYAEFVLIYRRTEETFTLRHYGDFPHRFLDVIKGEVVKTVNGVAPDAEGNVEVETAGPAVVSGHTSINGNTYTMTLTLDDGSTSVNVVEVTDGLPTKITVDGVEIPWTWEEVTADG